MTTDVELDVALLKSEFEKTYASSHGCGAGTDTLVAAQMVGEEQHVTGLDC